MAGSGITVIYFPNRESLILRCNTCIKGAPLGLGGVQHEWSEPGLRRASAL